MSQVSPRIEPASASRPGFIDYFLILCGGGLSLLLVEWSDFKVSAGEGSRLAGSALVRIHAYLLFLPQGILLGWPLFYATQRAAGRDAAMTVGEWVWGLAWLGSMCLVGYISWKHFGGAPNPDGFKKTMMLAYVVFVLTTAAIAVLLLLIDVVGRWAHPWTHHFCLALLIWPALPLAALWLWNLKLE
jgi:hypothetical protein